MKTRWRKWLVGSFAVISLMTSGGCVGVLVGAAAGAGGYAWVKGALVKEFDIPAEKLHRAAVGAMRDLKLAVDEDKSDRLSARISGRFADGRRVLITIDAKTERTSSMKIRVGVFGDKIKSEMIYEAVKKRT